MDNKDAAKSQARNKGHQVSENPSFSRPGMDIWFCLKCDLPVFVESNGNIGGTAIEQRCKK